MKHHQEFVDGIQSTFHKFLETKRTTLESHQEKQKNLYEKINSDVQ